MLFPILADGLTHIGAPIVKDWIGKLKGHGRCQRCKRHWNVVEPESISHRIKLPGTDGEFVLYTLCHECFMELPELLIKWYYTDDVKYRLDKKEAEEILRFNISYLVAKYKGQPTN